MRDLKPSSRILLAFDSLPRLHPHAGILSSFDWYLSQSLIINSKPSMFAQRKSSSYYLPKDDPPRAMLELREGDWICLSCSNLNFSFRTVCNRCKLQTKDSNFPRYFNFIIPPPLYVPPIPSKSSQPEETSGFLFEQNKENKPFQSALLLTPTKNQYSSQDDEPYKSPCSLPSVSPLLKKYNSSQLVQCSTKAKVSSPLADPHINKFQLSEETFSPYRSEADEEISIQISHLLSEIEIEM